MLKGKCLCLHLVRAALKVNLNRTFRCCYIPFSFARVSHAPPTNPQENNIWKTTLHDADVFSAKTCAKFSSNEKQAFSAARWRRCFRWWWKVKTSQPNHPNTHPPLNKKRKTCSYAAGVMVRPNAAKPRCAVRLDRQHRTTHNDPSTHQQQLQRHQ